jgi:RNA polymerase sigma-70 factor, ECF subfamily
MMTNWDAVVLEYGPLVWRTACRLLTHEADAADCFQRTFLAAVELAGAERVRDWAGFLKRVATARALEQLRSRYRDAPRSAALPDELPSDSSASGPLEQVIAGELATALRIALAAIDPAQADVFCLICLEDFSYRDAAGQLGITPNHAGVLLNRARAALRERLAVFDPNRDRITGGHHD